MKATTARKLLEIGLEPADELVTFHAYVKAKAGVQMNAEQCEAFGRDVYGILVQLVFDNPLAIETKLSFPRIQNEFSLRNLTVWCEQVQTWHAGLSRADRTLVGALKFIP